MILGVKSYFQKNHKYENIKTFYSQEEVDSFLEELEIDIISKNCCEEIDSLSNCCNDIRTKFYDSKMNSINDGYKE